MTTTRARLTGGAAAASIAALVSGIPLVLLGIGANPLPDALPTWDQLTTALTSPDDGALAMTAITLVGWLAWAFLTAAIGLEIVSRLRRAPTPHLPGLALPQAAARGLVGAAVLLFVAAPTITAPAAHAAPAPAQTAPASITEPAVTHTVGVPAGATRAVPARDHQSTTHTVTRGESLWSIAKDHLGSGHRWTELAAANQDTVGDHPDQLESGTVLYLPDANTAHPDRSTRQGNYRVQEGDTLSGIAQDQLATRTVTPRSSPRPGARGSRAAGTTDRPRPHRPRGVDPHHLEPGRPATGELTHGPPRRPAMTHRRTSETRLPQSRPARRRCRPRHLSLVPTWHQPRPHTTWWTANSTPPHHGSWQAWPEAPSSPGPCGCCCDAAVQHSSETAAQGAPSPPHRPPWPQWRRRSPPSAPTPRPPSSTSTWYCAGSPPTARPLTSRCPRSPPSLTLWDHPPPRRARHPRAAVDRPREPDLVDPVHQHGHRRR